MKHAALVLLAVLALGQGTRPSGADFVAESAHATTSVGAAAVFNTVAVSLADPGSPLRGTATLSATASSDEPLANVKIQRAPAGTTTWTDICTDSIAPYTCNWATSDGLYDLRAVATDTAGFSQASATVASRRADNTAPSVSVVNPGGADGATTVTASSSDGGSGVKQVAIEYKAAAASTWTALCTDTAAPFNCSWNAAPLPEGAYHLRATSTDHAGNSATSSTVTVAVDHTPPTVAAPPDAPVTGTTVMSFSAADSGGSGIAYVRLQGLYQGTWYTVCEDSTAPYSCTVDSHMAADGVYQVRTTATDRAGTTTVSAPVQVTVDNTAPSTATMADPGSPLSGAVALSGTAADATSGIERLRFEFRPAGSAGAWTTACADTAAPFTGCGWDTAGIADGSYDLRAVAVDVVGLTKASATVAARVVSNVAPYAKDVQAANGGVAGQLDAGDAITFTYSQAIKKTSIDPSWTGEPLSLVVRVVDNGTSDALDFYDAANTARLNLTGSPTGLDLKGDHVTAGDTSFAATATRTGSQIVVVLGARTGTAPAVVAGSATMTWAPATAATSETDVAVLAATATETGAGDADF